MFRSSKTRKQTKVQTHSDDEFDLEEADFEDEFGLHPLDTYSPAYTLFNELVFVWVWKFMSPNLSYDDLPPVPKSMRAKVVRRRWQTMYNQRKQRNLSVSTLQMIWQTYKSEFIQIMILQALAYAVIVAAFYIFKNSLWLELEKINEDNANAYNVFNYALQLFFIFLAQNILQNSARIQVDRTLIRIKSCLILSLYTKALSLDINESDKQKVLNVLSSDVERVRESLSNILRCGTPFIVFFVAMGMLYGIVGVSSLFGIIFLFFIGFPVQLFVGLKLFKFSGLRMEFADQRIQLITESVRGIRVLKVCCYELPLMDKVNKLRAQELNAIKKRNCYLSLLVLSMFVIPTLMLVITLIVYIFVYGNEMDSDITVFVLMLFSVIQLVVRAFPGLFSSLAGIASSAKRIDRFHAKNSVEFVENENIFNCNDLDKTTAIEIKEGAFEWNKPTHSDDDSDDSGFKLNDISLKIKRGKLVAIIGSVGCGKSSLLQAIIQEMKCVSGELRVNLDEIVYCSQLPYIRNLTLRENVILELPFDETVYKQCIINSALLSDLRTLENSDLTVIGDDGVNLSGGQKMRVAFARTLYRHGMSDKKGSNHIFIFDDPLSCVDIYVGRRMFLEGIHKYLMKNSTCIVVLNSHLHLLKYFDDIIIMDKGQIGVHSSVNDLFYSPVKNDDLRKYQHLLPGNDQLKDSQMDINYIENDEKRFVEDFEIDLNVNENYEDFYTKTAIEVPTFKLLVQFIRSSLTKFDYKSNWFPNANETVPSTSNKRLQLQLIKLLIPLVLSVLVVCFTPGCDLWLLFWNHEIEKNEDNDTMKVMNVWYLFVWLVMLSIIGFGTVYTMLLFTDIALKSSNYVHSKSLYNLLRANTLFYDLTPRGDIMNRFSADTDIMDIHFVGNTYNWFTFAASTFGYFILIIAFIPFAIIPLIVLSPVLAYLHSRFESPFFACVAFMKQRNAFITSLFSETVVSLDTIRSYQLQSCFMSDLEKRVDNVNKSKVMSMYLAVWQNFYEITVINFLQFFVTMVCIYQIQLNYTAQNRQFVILALWYFVAIQIQLFTVTVKYIVVKSDFTSIMRIMHYHHVFEENEQCGNEMIHEPKPINADYQIRNECDNAAWPTVGNIDMTQLKLKYRKKFTNFQLDIDTKIKVEKGQKIGICGRTGSGKSSILASVFRLFEPGTNDAVIDGLSLGKLGLYDLRSNLSIVSQDPVLFSGSLRFNLDPYNEYSDYELWAALTNVQCADLIQNREGKLECTVGENGSNFSVGERQLICFARSLLLKSPVWFLDEPTSSIDKNTDNIIQNLIRSAEFDKVTVICIAHRLQTIIDYDYILLLKNGKIKEYDTPQNLLKDKNGDFFKLVQTDKLYYRM